MDIILTTTLLYSKHYVILILIINSIRVFFEFTDCNVICNIISLLDIHERHKKHTHTNTSTLYIIIVAYAIISMNCLPY